MLFVQNVILLYLIFIKHGVIIPMSLSKAQLDALKQKADSLESLEASSNAAAEVATASQTQATNDANNATNAAAAAELAFTAFQSWVAGGCQV